MNNDILGVWNKRPLVISGPCSAETEEQVIETATQLAATGKVDMLRAGIWKPRTKPGMFEGVGAEGSFFPSSAVRDARVGVVTRENRVVIAAGGQRRGERGVLAGVFEPVERYRLIRMGRGRGERG